MSSFLHTILLATIAISMVDCHMYLSSVTIAGVDQQPRNCLRPLYGGPVNPIYKNSPINDVSLLPNGLLGGNMTCGFLPYANQPANKKCPIAAGSKVGMIWHHDSASATDDIVADSHLGPCLVYMAKSDTGAGPVWFKIFEEGINIANQQWCSMRVKANKGLLEFTIPANLPSGNYLMRGEVIALHDGNTINGAQPYVSCAEITLTGPADGVLPSSDYLVAIPGAYKPTDPGLKFNVYNTAIKNYTIPGPKLYKGSGTGTDSSETSAASTLKPFFGLF